MKNSSIFLESKSTIILRLDCIDEMVTDQHGKVMMSRLWIDPEDNILIDFHLYSLFDQAEVDQKILINEKWFTVTKVIKKKLIGFSSLDPENRRNILTSNVADSTHYKSESGE
ncbi:hypothetical protein I2F17_12040 [Acinetobacter sp. B10A]|uniref:hypothetical protein n=1 Tax=Acinetobacter baretiae TaxID=2605383 RepID=UPI001B3C96AE|nr:hypothetical protein [Acinetobacter baretiae]MBF7686548.1 hypothetical protein [Acinetobacter baretiae]